MRAAALTRGARGIGALACLLLALLSVGWIARDLSVAVRPGDVWWTWLGQAHRPREFTAWATSALDPLLLLGALAAAVAAVRTAVAPAVAAGALAAVAAVTVLSRVPLLWVLGAGWLQGLDGALTGRARLTAIGQLAAAAVLLVVLAAGRRPGGVRRARPGGGARALPVAAYAAYGVVHAAPHHGTGPAAPGRPRRGPATATALLLAAAGLAVAAWEVHWWRQLGWDTYRKGLLGDASVFRALLQPPVHWQAAALALFALGAAVAALRRAPWAGPTALAAAVLLCADGAGTLAFALRTGQLGRFPLLPAASRLELATAAFVVAAGLAALVTARRPAERAGPGAAPAVYGPAGGYRPPHAPPPPSTLPPGW
ncbi:hypothetical protein ACIQNI_02645 [Streptomyces sp. NPDC091266]|uniref:hypothetical protein n=1 Tax=Streptomyces sp. NPDC091266 TaxID=3365978 RepID=UPI00382D7252